MALQIKSNLTTNKEQQVQENKINSPVNNNYKEVLAKYDGREISSLVGCIAKDLFCPKINQLTGSTEMPELFIDDYVLK
jgi:hypothetical protein